MYATFRHDIDSVTCVLALPGASGGPGSTATGKHRLYEQSKALADNDPSNDDKIIVIHYNARLQIQNKIKHQHKQILYS